MIQLLLLKQWQVNPQNQETIHVQQFHLLQTFLTNGMQTAIFSVIDTSDDLSAMILTNFDLFNLEIKALGVLLLIWSIISFWI